MSFKSIKLFSLSVISLPFLVACQAGENQTNIELIQDMMVGPQIKTQEGTLEGEMLMRVPPEGTVSREYKPYPHDKFDIDAANSLNSPKSSLSREELAHFNTVGKEKYEIYCGVCHGNLAKGDGPIASKMIKRPPSLVTDVYKSYSDGRLYNVVTNGWGLMGGYGSQITSEKDRWAVVDYVRKLQGKGGN
jgi:cytochrome c5